MRSDDHIKTLEDVLRLTGDAERNATRRRDMISAVKRLCEMAGTTPAGVLVEAPPLRGLLSRIRPAAHGISAKSYSNLRSLLTAALRPTGIIDSTGRGEAGRHPIWGPLLQAIADDKRLSNGLAAFANWCTIQDISPQAVDDAAVQRFLTWLEGKTLYPKPRDLVRRVPNVWNDASTKVVSWPKNKLTPLSFRAPSKHLNWADLSASFQRDAEAYLALRSNPDLFDERPEAPRRPLAATTLNQQREHLRLAASVLVESGEGVEEIVSLTDLLSPKRFKTVLRYYHDQAKGEPNAFIVCLAQTLIQVAQYHCAATPVEISALKRIAAKLPAVPFDLTSKNKVLLRQLESERLRAKLLFLPEQLMGEVAKSLDTDRMRFVDAQVAVAIDILLAIPLRPQNLTGLNWQHHFSEPNGSRGTLLLHIPARDTKTKRQDITVEVPDDVARRLRWYRRHVLSRLGGDVNGCLFVTERGGKKSQATLTQQIIEGIARHVGIHMTPHQFRHFGATSYLEQHPEDFETARSILGHAYGKTTRIYAGSSTRRASRAYNDFLFQQREDLKLMRPRKK
ncbi:MAG TPA: site-specific integrase [Methyloceanibacter sp.]|nr:site-specific integrase [Methyloceanibacter sp.]